MLSTPTTHVQMPSARSQRIGRAASNTVATMGVLDLSFSDMSRSKYPLHPLTKLRRRQVEAATEALADAVKTRERRQGDHAAADSKLVRSDEEARRERQAERAELEQGGLRAADLHRAGAWEMGVAADRRRLADAVTTAERAEVTAREKEANARGDLAAREADAKVVEKDEARFEERQRQRVLAKEEEESEDRGAQRSDPSRKRR